MQNKLFLVAFLLLLVLPNATAQNKQDKIPLTDLFVLLQERYQHRFNYVQDVVLDVSVALPNLNTSLEEILQLLEKETGLQFEILSGNIVSVRKIRSLLFCGYLKNKDNLQAVSGATIQVEKISAITNSAGYFELEMPPRNSMVRIRHVGFKTLSRNLTNFNTKRCSEVYLIPQVQALSEVVLSSYLAKGISKVNDGSFEIDFEQFTTLPGLIDADVLQSVQAFPGIQSVNETVSNINIRGGTHDQNLIEWDRIKMYQSGHFFGLISMFHPQITQKVSLYKNGTTASATDGVSGTISMETDKMIATKFKGTVGVNLTDVNAFVDLPTGSNSSIQIAGRSSYNGLVETPTYTNYFERISQDTEIENTPGRSVNDALSFDFYDGSLRWLYQPNDENEIRVNFMIAGNDLVFNENASFNNEIQTRESSLQQTSIAGGIEYKRRWNDRFQSVLHLYESDYKLRGINADIQNSLRFLQENIVSETGVRLDTYYQLTDNIQWANGYQFAETKVTNLNDVDSPRFRSLIGEVLRTHAVFSEARYRSKDRFTNLSLGARANYLAKFDRVRIEPRLSFNQRFLSFFTVEVLGELKHQSISKVINFQNDFLGIERRRWQLSDNDSIPVITSKQASVGLNYSRKGWLVSTDVYYKKVDGITTQSQGFQNQYEFTKSAGSYDAIGADVLIRKQYNFSALPKGSNLNTWISYSYLSSDYTFEALPEVSFPNNFDITHSFTAGTTFSWKDLSISAGYNWRSGKPATRLVPGNEVVNGTLNFDTANSERLPEFSRLDLSAAYSLLLTKDIPMQLSISIWNVLDKQNIINNFYRVNDQDEAQEFTQRSLGLTPNVSLRVYF
ncbi:TonB-dependent receptor [Ascidiimonas sp. W6]|uniref:TonB-dependent receptor n=1 Tax=Ascidiimonas meishanensis TaxID=3128903 RepID=UPI0030EDCCBA